MNRVVISRHPVRIEPFQDTAAFSSASISCRALLPAMAAVARAAGYGSADLKTLFNGAADLGSLCFSGAAPPRLPPRRRCSDGRRAEGDATPCGPERGGGWRSVS